jgi:hypothetical protein
VGSGGWESSHVVEGDLLSDEGSDEGGDGDEVMDYLVG